MNSVPLGDCHLCGCDQIQTEQRFVDFSWVFRMYCRNCDQAGPRGVAQLPAKAYEYAAAKWNAQNPGPLVTERSNETKV